MGRGKKRGMATRSNVVSRPVKQTRHKAPSKNFLPYQEREIVEIVDMIGSEEHRDIIEFEIRAYTGKVTGVRFSQDGSRTDMRGTVWVDDYSKQAHVTDPTDRAICIQGNAIHEADHVEFTDAFIFHQFQEDMKAQQKKKGYELGTAEIVHRLWNSVEDGMIERRERQLRPARFAYLDALAMIDPVVDRREPLPEAMTMDKAELGYIPIDENGKKMKVVAGQIQIPAGSVFSQWGKGPLDKKAQISAAILAEALPSYQAGELHPDVKKCFDECQPLIANAVTGNSADCVAAAYALHAILGKHDLLPKVTMNGGQSTIAQPGQPGGQGMPISMPEGMGFAMPGQGQPGQGDPGEGGQPGQGQPGGQPGAGAVAPKNPVPQVPGQLQPGGDLADSLGKGEDGQGAAGGKPGDEEGEDGAGGGAAGDEEAKEGEEKDGKGAGAGGDEKSDEEKDEDGEGAGGKGDKDSDDKDAEKKDGEGADGDKDSDKDGDKKGEGLGGQPSLGDVGGQPQAGSEAPGKAGMHGDGLYSPGAEKGFGGYQGETAVPQMDDQARQDALNDLRQKTREKLEDAGQAAADQRFRSAGSGSIKWKTPPGQKIVRQKEMTSTPPKALADETGKFTYTGRQLAKKMKTIKDKAEDDRTNLRFGNLNRRQFAKAVAGNPRVMRRPGQDTTVEAEMEVIIDLSYSTNGDRADQYRMAQMFAIAAEQTQTPLAIWGGDEGHYEFKAKDSKDKSKLAAIFQSGGGGTPTASWLEFSRARFGISKAQRKWCFIVTDGAANDVNAAREQVAKATSEGVQVFGLAFGCSPSQMDTQFGKGQWAAIDDYMQAPGIVWTLIQKSLRSTFNV